MAGKNKYKKTCEHFKNYPSETVIKIINSLDKSNKIILNNFESGLIKEDDSALTFKIFVLIRKKLEQRVIAKKDYDFYSNFEEPREVIEGVLKYLNKYELEMIEKSESPKNFSQKESISYFSLIRKIKSILSSKLHEEAETIYMLLNEKDVDKVAKVIAIVDDYDRYILKLRYGDDFKNPVRSPEWNDEHSEYFHGILIPKLKKELMYLDKPKPTASLKKAYNFGAVATNSLYGINPQKKITPVKKEPTVIKKEVVKPAIDIKEKTLESEKTIEPLPVDKKEISLVNEPIKRETEKVIKPDEQENKKEVKKVKEKTKKEISIKKESKREKSFKTLYPNIDIKQLKQLIKLLSKTQQDAIYFRNGQNLDEHISWDKEMSSKYGSILTQAMRKIDEIVEKFTKIPSELFAESNETLLIVLNGLKENYKNIIVKFNGENLDNIKSLEELSLEEKKLYLSALKSFQKNIEKYKSGKLDIAKNNLIEEQFEVKQSLKEQYNMVDFKILLFVVELLPVKQKELVYMLYGDNLDSIKNEYLKDRRKINSLKKSIEEIEKMINVYLEIESRNIKVSKGDDTITTQIQKKESVTKEEKKKLVKKRRALEEEKNKNLKHQMFEKYANAYKYFLTSEELEKIINISVDNYRVGKGVNIEIASKMTFEIEIFKLLAEKYRRNSNSTESLNILLFVIEKFSKEMKLKYSNLTDEQIESVIEETFKNYTADKSFKVVLEVNLRKLK